MHSNIRPGRMKSSCSLCRSLSYCVRSIIFGTLLTKLSDYYCRESVGISPVSLLPKDANGVQFKLKKVDCAVFLEPDSSLSNKIKRKLMALPNEDRSINQTMTAAINYLPLIASFKLERQTPSADPVVQLGIWSAALAERLRKLQGQGKKENELMALPVVTVVGHDWSVYYSYTTDNGERVSFRLLVFESSAALNHEKHKADRYIDVARTGSPRVDEEFCGHLRHHEGDPDNCKIWSGEVHAVV